MAKENLSERDLLIQLKTRFESFERYVREKFDSLAKTTLKLDDMDDRLIKIEGTIKDHNKVIDRVKDFVWKTGGISILITSALIALLKAVKII